MYRVNENVNQHVQEQEAGREAVSPKQEVELDIQVLEERIAPGFNLNRSETMSGEQRAPEDVELDIQVLEERIAPGFGSAKK